MKKRDIGIFLIMILAFVIWSNAFIAISILRQKVSAFELVILRFLPVGPISFLMTFFFFKKEALNIIREHYGRLIVMGALSVAGYNFLLNWSMSYLKPSAGSLLVSLTPLFVLLLAVKFLKEPYTWRRVVGTVLSFLGLAIVVILGKVGTSATFFIPLNKLPYAMSVLGASMCWAVYMILVKPIMAKNSALAVNYLVLTVGSLPLWLGFNHDIISRLASFETRHFIALFFLSVMCTLVAFALWSFGIKHWRASNVALFVYLNPPLTATFSYILLGQGITAYFFIGGIVMLSGVIMATYPGGSKSSKEIARNE